VYTARGLGNRCGFSGMRGQVRRYDRQVSEEYRKHLASLHDGWATPLSVVAGLVAEVSDIEVLDICRVVQGEQNEVYDVTLEGAPSLIVRISHRGAEAFEREVWVLGQCAARGVPAPRIHGLCRGEVEGEPIAAIVMDKVQGDRLCDVDVGEAEARRVLGEVGAWLTELHSIPVQGFGYLDGRGVGKLATMDDWLTGLMSASLAFEEAGLSVGLPATTIRSWLREIVDSFRVAPPRIALIHNDLLAGHVMVHDGNLSGIIDFGEIAAEPAANDFAKWDFVEGERFPVEWIQDGYRDASLFQPPNDRTYRALWLANGLWRLRWYYETGFGLGADAARDRLLRETRR
jgi:aminoglycoside phosphotransferase (APT) family kinase protein